MLLSSTIKAVEQNEFSILLLHHVVRSYILASICSPAFEIKILAKHKASFFHNWDKIQKSQRHSWRISFKKLSLVRCIYCMKIYDSSNFFTCAISASMTGRQVHTKWPSIFQTSSRTSFTPHDKRRILWS